MLTNVVANMGPSIVTDREAWLSLPKLTLGRFLHDNANAKISENRDMILSLWFWKIMPGKEQKLVKRQG